MVVEGLSGYPGDSEGRDNPGKKGGNSFTSRMNVFPASDLGRWLKADEGDDRCYSDPKYPEAVLEAERILMRARRENNPASCGQRGRKRWQEHLTNIPSFLGKYASCGMVAFIGTGGGYLLSVSDDKMRGSLLGLGLGLALSFSYICGLMAVSSLNSEINSDDGSGKEKKC